MENLTKYPYTDSAKWFNNLRDGQWHHIKTIPDEIFMIVWNRYFESDMFVELEENPIGFKFRKLSRDKYFYDSKSRQYFCDKYLTVVKYGTDCGETCEMYAPINGKSGKCRRAEGVRK